jgi:hypothetical protein
LLDRRIQKNPPFRDGFEVVRTKPDGEISVA